MNRPLPLRAPFHCAIISEWDWQYRVGFDDQLAQRIAEVADRIESLEERSILRAKMDWACGFISLDRFLLALETDEVLPSTVARLNQDKLLHLPPCLAEAVAARTARLADKLGGTVGRALDELLRASLDAPYRPLSRGLFEHVFGAQLDRLLRTAKAACAAPHPGFAPISPEEARAMVDVFMRDAARHPLLCDVLDVAEVNVRYTEEDSGFAEYWPRELVEGETDDLLVVHLNGQSLDRLALEATLYHEIYGHGSFYSLLRTCRPPLIDHGALLLIEGWATGCEWHLSSPEYSAWARSRRLLALTCLDATAEELVANIDRMITEDNYAANRDARLTEAFQYPALSTSYALGGLWFEAGPGCDSMTDFACFLQNRAWGDFMAAWSR